MSDTRVLVSEAAESTSGDDLLDGLPPWMPDHRGSGNFKLLDTAGRAFDRVIDDVDAVDSAATVQHATSNAQLRELARLVDLQPKQNEKREKYRARVIAEFQINTMEGSIPELLHNLSEILDTDVEHIEYFRPSHGIVHVTVPGDTLDKLLLSGAELSNVVDKLIAAGFDIEVTERGTFTYISPTTYSLDNHDPAKGYDGLDANGDRKDNGGTYAGVIT